MLFSKRRFGYVLGACLLWGSSLPAQVDNERPYYLEFKVFDPSLDENAARFTSLFQDVLGGGEIITDYRLDEPGTGFKITDGVLFNSYLGLEAGLAYLGEADHFVSTLSGRRARLASESYALDIAVVVRYPFFRGLVAFGRAGAGFWRSEYEFKENGAILAEDHDAGIEAALGLGVRATLLDKLTLELAWDQTEYDSMDQSSLTLGFGFRY